MGFGSLAMAQDRDGRDNRRDGPQAQQQHRDDRTDRRDDRRSDRRDDRRADSRGDRQGAGPDHNFYRGSRLPSQYRSRQYVVDDWRGHRLSAPPRGYHWVQAGPDYVLAAIATGVIAQVLLSH
jgi:Ni/Co efflux regulator RcnB